MEQTKAPVWVVAGDDEKRRFKIKPRMVITGVEKWSDAKREQARKIMSPVTLPLLVNIWDGKRMGVDCYMLDADEWLSVDWSVLDRWIALMRGPSGRFAAHGSYASFAIPVSSVDGTLALLDELVNRVLVPAVRTTP